MIICNEKEIKLTDQTLSQLKMDSTVCYVFVGENPGGTEGDVYVFSVENNELQIYNGNIFNGNLTRKKLENIYPEAHSFYNGWNFIVHDLSWVLIPYVMGYYVFVRKNMADELQNNWKKVKEPFHYNCLVKGVELTVNKYENDFIKNHSYDSCIENNTENILRQIFSEYPNVWREPNRFKALLMDLLPQDKLLRNLLCICVDERIPDGLINKKTITSMEESVFRNKLINACGCDDLLANRVISMWLGAFEVLVDDHRNKELDQIKLEDLDLAYRHCNCLRRAGIENLADLAMMTVDELKQVRNIGRKGADEIIYRMKEFGVEPAKKAEENLAIQNVKDIKIVDLYNEGELTERTYKWLKRNAFITLGDVTQKSLKEIMEMRYLGRLSLDEILHVLEKKQLSLRKVIEEENIRYEEIQQKRNEKEKQDQIKCLKGELDDLGTKLQQLQMQIQIKLAEKKFDEGDFPGSVAALEEAVELGYNGDYSYIGTAYLTGENGVQLDISKGFKLLSKFYDEFMDGKLDIDDKGCMVQVCNNLALCYLWELQGGDNSDSLKQYKLNNVLDLFKEAVDYAPEVEKIDGSTTSSEMLMVIGCCFYYGEIHSEGHDDISIPTDYEYAYKAFLEAERLGNVQAITLLAEMYEEGKYVEEDKVTAARKYLKAAQKSEKNAIAWCKKYYIDDLPWDKIRNRKSIFLSDVLPDTLAATAKKQAHLITLEDCYQIDFNDLKGDKTFKNKCLPQILDSLRCFVVSYNPNMDENKYEKENELIKLDKSNEINDEHKQSGKEKCEKLREICKRIIPKK